MARIRIVAKAGRCDYCRRPHVDTSVIKTAVIRIPTGKRKQWACNSCIDKALFEVDQKLRKEQR